MKNFIEDNISFNELAPYDRSELILEVEHGVLLKKEKELQLDLALNYVIPYHDLLSIEEKMKAELPGVSRVSFRFRYEKVVLDESTIVSMYVPYMFHSMTEFNKYAHSTDIHDCRQEEDHVIIYCLGEQPVKILNEIAAPAMHNMLLHDFGIRRVFAFQNREESYHQRLDAMKQEREAELKQVHKAMEQAAKTAKEKPKPKNPENFGERKFFQGGGGSYGGSGQSAGSQKKRGYEGPVEGNRIIGRHITGSVSKIKELHQGSRGITIEGSVFRTDSRTLKNEKSLAFIYMTDHTDSICVKMFVTAKKQEDFNEYIKAGTYIRVHGNCEYDTFEKMVVLVGESIELAEKPNRMDQAPKKRVELHAHTKMSQIDGVMDVADLVKTAKKWGHPAVAVTDHGVDRKSVV